MKLRSSGVLVAPSVEPARPQFQLLISDPKMLGILERRWTETLACQRVGADLAATVMLGGLLEAACSPWRLRSGLALASQKWDILSMRRVPASGEKPLHWVGSSKRDFLEFPKPVQEDMGNALGIAQFGGAAPSAKPWKGLGSGVLELVESHDGNAYRAVYTVRFEEVVYVLHAVQKKSPSGIRTAKRDVVLVADRLKAAQKDHEEQYGKSKR